MPKRTPPKSYFDLLDKVRNRGGIGPLLSGTAKESACLTIRTYYPGCDVFISNSDQRWRIDITNRDPEKISTETILAIFKQRLSHYPAADYFIKNNGEYDFRKSSICLENWRDIYEGRIDELVADNDFSYAEEKIGAFGFLKDDTKPERLSFANKAKLFSDRLTYINTDKYSESKKAEVPLIAYKRRFKYIIDLPGHTYSTKLYWMLFLKRPVFLVEPILSFNWHKVLIPWIHYIPVDRDMGNLMTQFEWAESNPDKVDRIQKNLYELAIHTFPPSKIIENFDQFLKDQLISI